MSKKSIASGQLSLFDLIEPVQVDEEDLSYTEKDFIPSSGCPHMPEYIVVGQTWADGDTSDEALEHLQEVELSLPTTFKDTNMDIYKYLPISASIIGKKVWIAYQYNQKLVRYIPHPTDTDDE